MNPSCFPRKVLAIIPLLIGSILSCNGQTDLSGTLNVADFSVAAGETARVSGDLMVNATGGADIAGRLMADVGMGYDITITAEGDVNITGMIAAGHGGPGNQGGHLTIISHSGNVVLSSGASIAAGDGGEGVIGISQDANAEGTASRMRMIIGGGGGIGGSLTLRAPNGTITVADVEGIIHLGNGGHGATIEIHGEDLLTTDTPEELDNGGGDSGMLTIQAMAFNGIPIPEGETFAPDPGTMFTGGVGGTAGDFFYGQDENGNSTWPENADTSVLETDPAAKSTGRNQRKIFNDKLRSGKNGGNGIFSPGNGGSVRVRGASAIAPGGDGQNVFAFGGVGGRCLSLLCPDGGNGGDAYATGGDGGTGSHPNGTGGDGGKGDATGGLGGASIIKDGRHGDALAFGGKGGKGGGICTTNVTTTGGRGGFGGGAFASGGDRFASANGGDGGDGGDGTTSSGPVGTPLLASAFGGPGNRTRQNQGMNGNAGKTCPPPKKVAALMLSNDSDAAFGQGMLIDLACITGGQIIDPEDNCDCEHLHGAITIAEIGGPYEDPDPNGCGNGCVMQVDIDAEELYLSCQ